MAGAMMYVLLGALAAHADAPPNVVLIIADDQGWTDFGFMGHKVVKTPHLDKLAAESALFPNGYVPTSLCRASLATLLTGQYGHQHRICCNDPPDGVDRTAMHPFIKTAPSLPRLLRDKGYRSLQTGKFWEGHYANAGFTHGMTTKGRHGDDGLVIGRQTMKPIYDFIEGRPAEKGDSPRRREGDSPLFRPGNTPFFVWYAPMMPHEPHNPPDRILKKYAVEGRDIRLARYYGMIEWFDETVGQLAEYLDNRKLRDNTLLIFVVDNGWIQQEGNTRTTRGWFAPKSKLSPYDGGLRTPVLIRWPGKVKPGKYEDLVSTIDIVPTILTAAGMTPPREMHGLSLLETAAGKGPLKRDAVFGEIYVHTAINLEKPELNLTHRWVRQGDWKLILTEERRDSPELYNLKDDPFEMKNLVMSASGRAVALQKRLDAWWNGR